MGKNKCGYQTHREPMYELEGTDQKERLPLVQGSNPELSGSPGQGQSQGRKKNHTLSQVTCGWGRPVILQENRPICPSLTTDRPSLVANFGGHSPQMLGRVSTAGHVNLSLERNQQRIQQQLRTSPIYSHPNHLCGDQKPGKGSLPSSLPQTHF